MSPVLPELLRNIRELRAELRIIRSALFSYHERMNAIQNTLHSFEESLEGDKNVGE